MPCGPFTGHSLLLHLQWPLGELCVARDVEGYNHGLFLVQGLILIVAVLLVKEIYVEYT